MRGLGLFCFVASFGVLPWCGSVRAAEPAAAPGERQAALRGCMGTYSAPPRGADGHVDNHALLDQLKDLGANTYAWLIWMAPTDWDDLQKFLPLARQQGVRVWVVLVPPSESPPRTRRFSEPFRTDYERWGTEIAKLSLSQPNLVAWSIDDFTLSANLKFFTPQKLSAIVAGARQVNPKLAFVPCTYFRGVTAAFARDYAGSLDGVLFPYRHDSAKPNLTDTDLLKPEIARLRERLGPHVPIVLDVYSTAHSRLGASTPQYVKDVLTEGRSLADGLMVYCHPNPKTAPDKYAAVREAFHAPAAAPN
jgi:hypothetical protein